MTAELGKAALRGGSLRASCAIAFAALSLALAACRSSSDDPQPPPPPDPPQRSGLDGRPSNTTCVAPALADDGDAEIRRERVFANLSFSQPLGMLQAPGDDSRWFVLEKETGANPDRGRVRVFKNEANVAAFDADFIELPVNAASEGGLLGMAFDPQFATNRRVYLSWTEGNPMDSVVARFTVPAGGATLDPGSRFDLLRVDQPFQNHNGGNIAFGPDGFLYVGLGDGGDSGDPQGHAQNTRTLLGTILRLDVSGAGAYTIPPTNPFAGQPLCTAAVSAANCPEIYAWGLRNPWRFSFDRATGELWAGDVGQNQFEEIDRIELGGNYGWNCREAAHAYASPSPACSTATGLVDPVHEYGRSLGGSVTGGYVYRGTAIPALVGSYVFGDYSSGRIWRLVGDGAGGYAAEELLDTSLGIASFGEDVDGELYVVDLNGGTLHKIVAAGAASNDPPVADLLSATGCVSSQDARLPAAGLVPYEPAAAFWSDGADKERWLAIPNGATIAVDANDDFVLPEGTVLMKHFRLGTTLVETRLFMRHLGGEWRGYSYEWNGAQTDATLVADGKTVAIGGQSWIFPSGNDCLACHTQAAGRSLGLEIAQLNHAIAYPSTGRTANQLATLSDALLLASPIGDPSALPTLADPFDTTRTLAERARAYLHTNCAQCHRPSGPTPSSLDLRFTTLLSMTGMCAVPQSGDLGLGTAARIVAPGDPDVSVLLQRMDRRDAFAMPPLASSAVDADGVALVRAWIAALGSCP